MTATATSDVLQAFALLCIFLLTDVLLADC